VGSIPIHPRHRPSSYYNPVVGGPFTEAKEVIGGYAVIEAGSKEEAIEWASHFTEVIGDTVGQWVRRRMRARRSGSAQPGFD
jgi:hypothetical protein